MPLSLSLGDSNGVPGEVTTAVRPIISCALVSQMSGVMLAGRSTTDNALIVLCLTSSQPLLAIASFPAINQHKHYFILCTNRWLFMNNKTKKQCAKIEYNKAKLPKTVHTGAHFGTSAGV